MVDDLYVVGLDFRQLGTPHILQPRAEQQLRRMQSNMDRFQRGWTEFSRGGAGVLGVIDGVASSLGRIALIGGGLVAAGGMALLTKATVGLNSELEKATISLGTIFNVQGMTSGLNQGLAVAKGTIADMRKDAAALPGEFSDLLTIFKLGATSAFQSGMSIDEWRDLAAQTMASGVVADLGGGLPQVAREMTMLLQGRAGAHNIFGMTLGLSGAKAQAFNKMEGRERADELKRLMAGYGEAIPVFSQTWDAVSSTLIDNAKKFALAATSPLFDRIKGELADANKWYDENQETVQRYAEIVGMRLGEAWDWGKEKALEWGPVVLKFAENFYDRMSSIWEDIEPGVTRIGELLKDALKDPGTIDKMITLAKLWLAIKGGQMLVGGGQAAWGMGKGLWGMAGGLGSGALSLGAAQVGGAAAGGVGAGAAAGGTAATVGAGAVGAGAAGGAAVGVGASLAGLATAAGAASMAVVAWYLAGDQAWKLWQENFAEGASEEDKARAAVQDRIKREIASWTAAGLSADQMADRLNELESSTRVVVTAMRDFSKEGDAATAHFGDVSMASLDLAANLYAAAAAAMDFQAMVASRVAQVTSHINDISPEGPSAMKTVADEVTMMATIAAQKALRDPNFMKPAPGAEKSQHKGGGGGTRVQKVEIVVTANENPSRVARVIMDELGHITRLNKSSKFTKNFSGVSR